MTTEAESYLLEPLIADLQSPATIEDIYKTICAKHKTRTGAVLHTLHFLLHNDALLVREKHIAVIVHLQLCDETKDASHRQLAWALERSRDDDNIKMLIYEMVVLHSFEKVS